MSVQHFALNGPNDSIDCLFLASWPIDWWACVTSCPVVHAYYRTIQCFKKPNQMSNWMRIKANSSLSTLRCLLLKSYTLDGWDLFWIPGQNIIFREHFKICVFARSWSCSHSNLAILQSTQQIHHKYSTYPIRVNHETAYAFLSKWLAIIHMQLEIDSIGTRNWTTDKACSAFDWPVRVKLLIDRSN